MKINLLKTANGKLWPADEDAEEAVKSMGNGEVYSCDVKLNQNYKLHQKIYAFFKFVAQHYYGDLNPTKDQINLTKKNLLIGAGYCKQIFHPNGQTFEIEPMSLKYEKMPPDERSKCYKAVTDSALMNVFSKSTDENTINQLMNWF